ncbi:MAG TPA: sigma-70 family RNA polymerase sigma factor [Dysgonamonadaceae bacterium]|nr:sigma-70 family RNA polymerase sigma factor [Dysgonamonadaceae bacterium]
MENRELIAACKKQDTNAQRELYETYAPRLLGLCMMYCKDSDTAQDMLHDGFLKVFTQIKKYSGRGSFEGWMRRVFVNTILEHFRKEKRKLQIVSEMEEVQEEVMDENLERLFNDSITEETLLKMIQELPIGYRTVFSLYVFEDMSHRQIAKQLGIKEAASRSQYSRAKASLKIKINEYIANKNG